MPSPKNWIKSALIAEQWNALVTDAGAVLSAISIANTTNANISVQLRLATAAGSPLSTILAPHTLAAYGADVLHLQSLALTTDQQLQIYPSAAGVQVVTTGTL